MLNDLGPKLLPSLSARWFFCELHTSHFTQPYPQQTSDIDHGDLDAVIELAGFDVTDDQFALAASSNVLKAPQRYQVRR